MNSKWIADHFQTVQAAILGAFIFIGLMTWTSKVKEKQQSKFKNREADNTSPNRTRPRNPNEPDLANAKLKPFNEKPKPPPLSLPGITLSGAPHEILGVAENANEAEIMRAYKEVIKRYHPDRMQNVAADQMKFYQEASTQINRAKEMMLEKARRK